MPYATSPRSVSISTTSCHDGRNLCWYRTVSCRGLLCSRGVSGGALLSRRGDLVAKASQVQQQPSWVSPIAPVDALQREDGQPRGAVLQDDLRKIYRRERGIDLGQHVGLPWGPQHTLEAPEGVHERGR